LPKDWLLEQGGVRAPRLSRVLPSDTHLLNLLETLRELKTKGTCGWRRGSGRRSQPRRATAPRIAPTRRSNERDGESRPLPRTIEENRGACSRASRGGGVAAERTWRWALRETGKRAGSERVPRRAEATCREGSPSSPSAGYMRKTESFAKASGRTGSPPTAGGSEPPIGVGRGFSVFPSDWIPIWYFVCEPAKKIPRVRRTRGGNAFPRSPGLRPGAAGGRSGQADVAGAFPNGPSIEAALPSRAIAQGPSLRTSRSGERPRRDSRSVRRRRDAPGVQRARLV
jgi:hypothetical protein